MGSIFLFEMFPGSYDEHQVAEYFHNLYYVADEQNPDDSYSGTWATTNNEIVFHDQTFNNFGDAVEYINGKAEKWGHAIATRCWVTREQLSQYVIALQGGRIQERQQVWLVGAQAAC